MSEMLQEIKGKGRKGIANSTPAIISFLFCSGCSDMTAVIAVGASYEVM